MATDTGPTNAESILASNQALRSWAAGLRTWSRATRISSSAERVRARQLVAGATGLRAAHGEIGRSLRPDVGLHEPVLPSLDDVRVDELVAVLVGRHHFGALGAVRAVRLALLMAGYPLASEQVLAADAFDILDSALFYPG
ncbi:hypothetical protein AAII07_08730 [Microvirga sp. 0TCS3.31]